MKRSVIWNLGCYTNTIGASQHFFSDWLLKSLELNLSNAKRVSVEQGLAMMLLVILVWL